MSKIDRNAILYQPKPRPDWALEFIDIGRQIDATSVVPLDEASLIGSAIENTGLSDFGDEDWREPFRILLDDLENTAELNFFGRVMTRSDLLIHLEGRLKVVDWYKRHPEVEDEVIESPLFIVGLPRAGSTLLEQILASHSQVDGTLELPNILALAHRLNGRRKVTDEPRYPGILAELSAEQLEELGRKYIEDTRIYREGAPFFTDKMPNNFRHIGLIRLILPNAKIIDARRDPMACCFSGFKQLFAEGQEFTYGLDEIGRYYRGYVELMDHWDEAAPGEILRVRYEDVVDDLESQVRRILDFCGLEFEEACVNFHETDRAVRTASSEQVRQPINRSGVEQWRPYEAHLDPLKQALGPSLTDY